MLPQPIKRALLSVSDKTHLIDFATKLTQLGVEIIATGGTAAALKSANVPLRLVEDLTNMPEMFAGRVKTLHPTLHAGILGKRDQHAQEAKQHGIDWIDLVVINFYPFTTQVKSTDMPWDKVVEYIDIGGPTMVRAAAKNFAWVGVVVDLQDYEKVLLDIQNTGGLTETLRLELASKAFMAIADYDAAIANYFRQRVPQQPQHMDLQLQESIALRYGENPHQAASAYQFRHKQGGVLSAIQHQGKSLSFNNLLDIDAALACVQEFSNPACVIIKHANPCGVAIAENIDRAYEKAYQADAKSAFGGIVSLNQTCTRTIAEAITNIFMEVIIAPDHEPEALAIFAKKPNLRVLQLPLATKCPWEMRFIHGGVLMQERDAQIVKLDELQCVTEAKPTQQHLQDLQFAWQVVKHIKSNAILIAKDGATIGVGAGQVSRIDAVEIAIRKAEKKMQDAVLASDAFFPFRDSVDRIAQTGIKAIIQPGGSIKDNEVITACNEHGIAMVLTGKRCFRH